MADEGWYLELGCGHCDSCRARRARDWAIRCYHEAQLHTRWAYGARVPNNCFVTLTLDDDHLPGDWSLDVRDWQLFAKRLRKHMAPRKLRFLHCGEYGSKPRAGNLGRPHYHAVLFGIDFHEDAKPWKDTPAGTVSLSKTLTDLWGKGFTTVAPLTFATASYTAGYVFKKLRTAEHMDLTPWRKPEYNTMSRRPGLAAAWIEKYWHEVYSRDQVNIGSKTYRPPAYYDKWLREHHPDKWEEISAERQFYLEKQGPTSDNELKARRSIWHASRRNRKPRHADLHDL